MWFGKTKKLLLDRVEKLGSELAEMTTHRDALLAELTESQEKSRTLHSELDVARISLKEAKESLIAVREELEALKSKMVLSENSNSVLVEISDDMSTIKPIVRYNEQAGEAMFKAGLLNDVQIENPFAIQLALITVTHDGLLQIIESFEEKIEDE